MKTTFILCLLATLLFSSCKTTEEIRREQLVDNLSIQVGQSQKIATDTLSKMQELELRVNQLSGNWEETHEHKTRNQGDAIKDLTARVVEIENKMNLLQDIQDKLEEQGKFIQNVTRSLKRLGASNAPRKSSGKKQSDYARAMSLFSKRQYTKALPLLKTVNRDPKIKYHKKAKVLHHLGVLSLRNKKYQEAEVYLSQLATNHQKTPFAPNGLLVLAKTFNAQNKASDARDTLKLLISSYPKAKQIKEARALLKTLN